MVYGMAALVARPAAVAPEVFRLARFWSQAQWETRWRGTLGGAWQLGMCESAVHRMLGLLETKASLGLSVVRLP